MVSFPEQPVAGFKVRLTTSDDALTLTCTGTLDGNEATSQLQPHFLQLHEKLVAAGTKKVRLDVTAVDYMNSSGVKCFMTWFLKAERAQAPYPIEIVFDPQRTWQYVAFTTMGRIAPKVLKTFPLQKGA